MNKTVNVKNITLVGMGIAINIIGAFIALGLRLPIYLDSVGTIFIACVLGPKYAVLTGVLGSLVSGMTFDIYSLYFAPVQISTGLLAGLMYNKGFLKGAKTPLGVFLFTLPTSLISAVIAAFLFGGVTSSGSSYIVQILSHFNVPMVVSVFITQVFTDYADKFLAVVLVGLVVKALPKNFTKELANNR
ncbi:MAG TPA: ECF transporter S component [Romboutsia timonensis]|uniref:ECF transporter S component n=1 Tax=Romboutsia timonensis TaxID=1776391 RepID=A0A921N041_9FIRM|nr:ECF transporter S component [Romboutsia timonensis]